MGKDYTLEETFKLLGLNQSSVPWCKKSGKGYFAEHDRGARLDVCESRCEGERKRLSGVGYFHSIWC